MHNPRSVLFLNQFFYSNRAPFASSFKRMRANVRTTRRNPFPFASHARARSLRLPGVGHATAKGCYESDESVRPSVTTYAYTRTRETSGRLRECVRHVAATERNRTDEMTKGTTTTTSVDDEDECG